VSQNVEDLRWRFAKMWLVPDENRFKKMVQNCSWACKRDHIR